MAKRRVIVVATTAALVIGGGGYALADSGGAGAEYRLATASLGDVEQTLALGGTVSSSARHDVTFAQSGTVATVEVKQGQTVKAGQVLATLNATSANATLLAAKAALAKARAALANTTSSQTSSVASNSSSSPATAATKKAQDQVREAVQAAEGAIRASETASASVSRGCAGVGGVASGGTTGGQPSTTPTGVPSGRPSAEASPSATPAPSTAPPSSTAGTTLSQDLLKECSAALAKLSQAQTNVSTAQQDEQGAIMVLAGVLQQSSGASTSSGSSRSEQLAGNGSSSSSSASQLAQNQATVDQAETAVVEAQVALDNAVLRAPVAGKVIAVSIAEGDPASTSTAAVTIIGAGVSTVVVAVPLAQISEIKTGEKAQVVVSGSSTAASARVSNVGMMPTTSTSGATTYPVTVSIDGTVSALQGIGASVTIVTGSVSDAVTVPASAITAAGTRRTVQVYSGGKLATTVVTVGLIGSSSASITSGLKAGQQVVLADVNAEVPTSSTSSNTRGFSTGFSGGFSGAGRPPGRG